MSSKIYAYVNLSLAMVIVGSSVVFGKIISKAFPVFLASGLRFAIACLIIFPLLFFKGGMRPGLAGKNWLTLIAMAFCGQFIFTLFVLLGLRYTGAIEAGIITSTSPVVMAMAAFILFREKPGMVKITACMLVAVGVTVVNGISFRGAVWSGVNLLGNLLISGAVLGEAFFLLLRKRIPSDISDLALTGYLCFLGLIMFFPAAIYQGYVFDFQEVSSAAWLSILYFGAVFTVLAYFFWFKGVSNVSGSTAGLFTAVMPVSAVMLSCIFLGEKLTACHLVGGGLILAAIIMCAAE